MVNVLLRDESFVFQNAQVAVDFVVGAVNGSHELHYGDLLSLR